MTAVAIVGAGLMGRWHAAAARRGGAVVRAIIDPQPARAERLAQAFGATAYCTLSDALGRTALDAVHVCTPTDTHEALALEALDAGCHVAVEKPLALDLAATRRLMDRATGVGRVVCPIYQFLFQQGTEVALTRLPRFGPLRHVDYVVCTAGADRLGGMDRSTLVSEILPHPLSLLRRLVGGEIARATWNVTHPADGELRATIQLGAVSASLLVSTHGRPTRNTMRLMGDHGTMHLDLFHGFALLERADVSRTRKIIRPLSLGIRLVARAGTNLAARAWRRESAYPGLWQLIARFLKATRGAPPPIDTSEILDVAAAADALSTAAGAGA